jgi:hypothetical protein
MNTIATYTRTLPATVRVTGSLGSGGSPGSPGSETGACPSSPSVGTFDLTFFFGTAEKPTRMRGWAG